MCVCVCTCVCVCIQWKTQEALNTALGTAFGEVRGALTEQGLMADGS